MAGRVFDGAFAGQGAGAREQEAPALTLDSLIDEFMDEPDQRAVTEKTRRGRRGMFDALRTMLGKDTGVADVTRQDARRVRDTILSLPPNSMKRWPKLGPEQAAAMARERGIAPMSTTMANAYLSLYSAVFRYAVQEHGLTANHFDGLRVRGSRSGAARKRRSFTEDELRALADNPPPGSLGLIMLVSFYNGLRLGEVTGLLPEDVREVGGVLCIDIRERDGRTLKTRSSERLVPAHPVIAPLLRKHMQEHGDDPWQDLPQRRRAAYASQKLNRYLRRLGMDDPALVVHSARHTFRDRMREAGVGRDAVLALGGWSGGGVEEIYGSGMSPAALLRELRRVRYAVDLSRMHEG